MKVSAIVDYPKIEPVDWDLWWRLWNESAQPVLKKQKNHNAATGHWIGFDCYRGKNFKEDLTPYSSMYVDCRHVLPTLYNFIDLLADKVDMVRILESQSPFYPHKDHTNENYSIRTLLYDNNVQPTFYYLINGKKIYQKLPNETNTWIYKDHEFPHGSDFNPKFKKILITFQGTWTYSDVEKHFANDKFLNYNIQHEL